MTGMKSAQQTNSCVKNKPTHFNHTKVEKRSESTASEIHEMLQLETLTHTHLDHTAL